MLTPEKLESWYGKVVKVGYTGSFEDWSAERLKCQTDLFYLTKDVLGYDLVDNFYCPNHPTCQAEFEGPCSVCGQPLQAYPGNVFFDGKTSIHRATCKFFVQKNPNKLISQQDEIKNRLLMVPRGSLKSSIDQADCVQWIIAFPDVRIALLTAAEDLAQAFVVNVRRFFVVDESENGERTFTKFQLLFPEHCVKDADKGPKDSFITPGRETKNIPQPSLHAISLQKTTSGTHYDCGKSDDVVSNKNSGHSTTSEQRDNVRKDIGLARSLIEPYGYHDNIGTPYADDDAYAYQLATSDPDNLKVMIHPAWKVKPESEKKKLADPLYKLGATDYEYLVPFIIKKGQIEPRLDYKFLKTASADVENFPCFPKGCLVLMADWSEKPIEDVNVGDEIVGYKIGGQRSFIKGTVEYKHTEESEVWKVTTNLGNVFYTTPEHKFLRHGKDRYNVLKLGTRLVRTHTVTAPKTLQEQLDLAWLGGIIDGEGTVNGCVQITQSTDKNPEICVKIEQVLKRLGISYETWVNPPHGIHKTANVYTLHGGRSLKIRLLQYAQVAKRERFAQILWKKNTRIAEIGQKDADVVTNIESIGRQTVYNIQSSTGNFVCQGLAVKNCQYLCQPNALRIVKFTKELFDTHTVGSEGLPQAGTYQTVMAWDFAYSDEKGRDFSVGSVGWMCIAGPLAGRCFVVDMVRGRFGKTELAQQVAKMAARWRVEKIGIENSSGANFLENDIMREVHRMGYSDCPIPEWFPVDTQKNAKNARAEGTETLLITDRLYFSSEIVILEDVVKEFINFKPGSKRKDDAVDSIGHLCRYLPTHIEIPRTQQEKNQAVHDLLVQKQINELIFMAPIKPEAPPPPPPTSWDGMPVISNMENFILFGK